MKNASLLIAALLLGLVAQTHSKRPRDEPWPDLEEEEGVAWEGAPKQLIDEAERQIEELVKAITVQQQLDNTPHQPARKTSTAKGKSRGKRGDRGRGRGKGRGERSGKDSEEDRTQIASKLAARRQLNRPRPTMSLETSEDGTIASKENGKRFLRKYCQHGKCNLPREIRMKRANQKQGKKVKKPLNNEDKGQHVPPRVDRKHPRQRARKPIRKNNPRPEHRKRRDQAKEGIAAAERSAEITHGKYADRRVPREDRPIVPLEEDAPSIQHRMQSYDKEFVIIKPIKTYPPSGKGDGNDHPPFEVNQINLHVDVDVRQQQAQQEKQAIVQTAKRMDHNKVSIDHMGRRARHADQHASPRHHSHNHPQRRRPFHLQTFSASSKRPRHPTVAKTADPVDDLSRDSRNHCSLAGMRRYMRIRLDKWRRAFESESMWAKTGMVMALGAIITMQVYVISKFIRMLFGRGVYDDGDYYDDDGDDDDKQECGRSNYKPRSRRSNRRRHSYDARAQMLDKN